MIVTYVFEYRHLDLSREGWPIVTERVAIEETSKGRATVKAREHFCEAVHGHEGRVPQDSVQIVDVYQQERLPL